MTLTTQWISSGQPYRPRAYQKRAIKFLLEHAHAGLFLDPGLGKTSITLGALAYLKKRGMIGGKTLIVAPLLPCYTVWPNEIGKWADFHGLTYTILHGPDKDAALQEKVDLYIINFDGLEWLLKPEKFKRGNKTDVAVNVKAFEKLGFENLVVDELSKFKTYSTLRFKMFKQVLHTFGRRWGLTGSPASNGLMGLFGQAFVLDRGRSLGQYITHYRNEFFVPDKFGYNWQIQVGAEDRIYERLSPLVLRMGQELIDMPDLVVNDIEVEIPDQARALYRDLEKHFLIAINQDVVTAQTAAVASMKLRQIACGGIYLEDANAMGLKTPKSSRQWVNLHSAKIEALTNLVEELQGQPLLVAYDFEHDKDRLKEAFPQGIFVSDLSMKQFQSVEAKWNRGEIPLLFGHPASVGHGLNLQGGHHVCWHSLTWDFELYDQFIRRVYRQGQKAERVFVHRLIAKDTIEEVIAGVLASKNNTQQALFDGLKKLAKNRRL